MELKCVFTIAAPRVSSSKICRRFSAAPIIKSFLNTSRSTTSRTDPPATAGGTDLDPRAALELDTDPIDLDPRAAPKLDTDPIDLDPRAALKLDTDPIDLDPRAALKLDTDPIDLNSGADLEFGREAGIEVSTTCGSGWVCA